VAHLLSLALLYAMSDSSFDIRRTLDDARMMPLLQELARRGAYNPSNVEVAAFIVRQDEDTFGCFLWPRLAVVQSAHYDGTIPAGTVAIAHTHPSYAELPSQHDLIESRRLGLPIYVISRRALYVIDPASGEGVALIANRNWIATSAITSVCTLRWRRP